MSTKYIILGLLSQKPMSGYALKKEIVEVPFFFSTANNNQIYKTLIELHKENMVVLEVKLKEKGAASKVYSITKTGVIALQQWILSASDPSDYISEFHQKLAFAQQLSGKQLDSLFSAYQEESRTALAAARELLKCFKAQSKTNSVQALLWESIYQHRVQILELELRWLERTKESVVIGSKK